MNIIKRASLMELFYDLIFVYAIANVTVQIHHLHHGIINSNTFFNFVIILASLLMIWMFQTMYNNLFGMDTIKDRCFIAIKMFILIFIANGINTNFKETFISYNLSAGLLMLVNAMEFSTNYFKKNTDNRVVNHYVIITSIVALMSLTSLILEYDLGVWFACLAVAAGWLLPLPFLKKKYMKQHAVNFPHLIERAELLTIITFGEMITGITGYFSIDHFNFKTIPIFLVLCSLFIFYTTEFEKRIDEYYDTSSGGGVAYFHFAIILGLIMITVSMSFLSMSHVDHRFLVNFLFTGLFLFYTGVLLHNGYNLLKISFLKFILFSMIFITGLIFSNIFMGNLTLVLIVTMIVTVSMAFFFYPNSLYKKTKS